MSQIILMSIQPQHYGNIEALRKTYEVRKNPLPSGTVVHVYLTKKWHKVFEKLFPKLKGKLGKVVAKFIVGKVRQITHDNTSGIYFKALCQDLTEEELLKQSCLRWDELEKYLLSSKNDIIYAYEITHLEIFDRPRELGEYKRWDMTKFNEDGTHYFAITHAPQSWQYAWVEE